jgi:glycosyltransferase involved in cell wall biosynthesis
MAIGVSVIIPCYNSSKTIKNCLTSVLNQTYPVVEIIVVDDGSTDNTLELINQIEKENSTNIQICVITQKNSGPSVARNNGIKHSNCEWIAFLDSDDMWMERKLEAQIDILISNPDVSMVSTFTNLTFNNENLIKTVNLNTLLLNNCVTTSSVLVKTKILKEYLFDESMKYSEDYKLWLQISLKNKILIIQKSLVIYNVNSVGSLSKNIWQMEIGELSNFLYLYKNSAITMSTFLFVSVFSLLKFSKRFILSVFK